MRAHLDYTMSALVVVQGGLAALFKRFRILYGHVLEFCAWIGGKTLAKTARDHNGLVPGKRRAVFPALAVAQGSICGSRRPNLTPLPRTDH